MNVGLNAIGPLGGSSDEDIEIHLLLEGIFLKYGYDFRNYSRASLKRRIQNVLSLSNHKSIIEMLDHLLRDPIYFRSFVSDMTVNVTEMFRDPEFYLGFREHVLPFLGTYPSVRIWHAGCSTGEEAYSMAILLKEAGLYERSLIYATDISARALQKAREGIYSTDQIQSYTNNYQAAGGREPFSNYYVAHYGSVKVNADLQKNIVFSSHNLATDDVFSEVHVIVCRNVLIYFNQDLQKRTFDLFERGLIRRGFLCLGAKETIELAAVRNKFEVIDKDERIYRKI